MPKSKQAESEGEGGIGSIEKSTDMVFALKISSVQWLVTHFKTFSH